MIPYHPREVLDDSGITLISADAPRAVSDAVHQHAFYELALVLRGSCEIQLPGSRAPLIPGDLFLICPDQPHVFRPGKNTFLLYCQFEPTAGVKARQAMQEALDDAALTERQAGQKRMRELRAFEQETLAAGAPVLLPTNSGAVHGLIHLNHSETDCIHTVYRSILTEQTDRRGGFESMKRLYLEQLLILVQRVLRQQFEHVRQDVSWQHEMIDGVLAQIDADLARDVDFEAIARDNGITLSHFRTVFKRVTGLPPTDYLNRVRILRALELLQTTDLPVSEIATQVGIYDANYFSRLFKKVTGYPPRYFKSIHL